MRMRRKKNLVPRMERCAQWLISDPQALRGNWRSLLPGAKELRIELGCGKGRFTCQTAAAAPEVLFVAVERVPDAMVMAMERARDMELHNVFFIDADAANLPAFFAPDEVDLIYINFCDPWPPKRHAKRRLTHRDFLGALMNLGIERAMIGDIVVKDLDGYVMVLKKISRYVLENLDTVGRTAVEAAVWEGAEELLEPEYEEVAGTVSSVRLDAIVALCGRVSRTKAAGLIAGEKVFINGQAVLSPSRQMEPGEILSIRGVGKFLFSRNGGQTKKGRISVTFLKYR